MMRKIDISSWKRKSHYEFFKDYDDPFYNICADVEVTELQKFCKLSKTSFFIASLYLSQKVINEIEELKYRITEEGVFICDTVNAGSTILLEDETFGFCYFEYMTNFISFNENAIKNIQFAKEEKKLIQNPYDEAVAYYSVIPWISFRSMSHAKKYSQYDSIPRVVFGKYFEQESKLLLPVSIEVHHSLVDGYHLGKYYDSLAEKFRNPSEYLF